MEKVKITKMIGTYYSLIDCYGVIETSKDYNKIKELYDYYMENKELQEETYCGCDMELSITKDLYNYEGRYIDSEVIL